MYAGPKQNPFSGDNSREGAEEVSTVDERVGEDCGGMNHNPLVERPKGTVETNSFKSDFVRGISLRRGGLDTGTCARCKCTPREDHAGHSTTEKG